jgi:hypothetical protein
VMARSGDGTRRAGADGGGKPALRSSVALAERRDR